MPVKVTMPQLGETVVEGTVAKWLVKEGDRVERDQPILEVSTDKVDTEIPSPAAGRVIKILVPEGQTVKVGVELMMIDEEAKTAASPTAKAEPIQSPSAKLQPGPAPKPALKPAERSVPEKPLEPGPAVDEPGEDVRLSPVVRNMIKEHGIEPARLKGTGMGGRITKLDVLNYLDRKDGKRPEAKEPASQAKEVSLEGVGTVKAFKVPPYSLQPGDQVIQFTKLRKLTAEHMVYSKHTAPHVTTVAEVDMHRVAKLREKHKAAVQKQHGVKLSYFPFVIAAAIEALKAYPLLNASVGDGQIILKKAIHIGMAVETEKGLIVPAIKQADRYSFIELVVTAEDLAVRAREGRLRPDDVVGGTFTVTNPGREGNLFGTPIIHQPQVGILRMGEVIKRPVVVELEDEDKIAIRAMMYLALSYDHRIIDGVTGNSFLHKVKEILEKGEFGLSGL
jgi:2-oxoglutarate dehydrogenase E2 component (dihydrolipoamide succinyltransferase)